MTVIYIDALVVLNLYVTFFLVEAARAFLHKKIRLSRAVLGALLGGVSSLVILLPELPIIVTLLVKLSAGIIVVFAVFGFHGAGEFLKNALVFMIINLLFAGLMLLLWFFSAPLGMYYNNGTAYFDLSFSAIVIGTAVSYGVIKLFRYILDTRAAADKTYSLKISYGGREFEFSAFPDTGNSLTDFFTGMPVIVCDGGAFSALFPEEIRPDNVHLYKGVRFLPYSTVGSSGLIPVFKPNYANIRGDGGAGKDIRVMIGISKEKLKKEGALFNPKLLL